jgi:hypothetical protein
MYTSMHSQSRIDNSMKPELDRVKNDLETMQKALGLAPSMGREWIQWMKRDKWCGLWWCLPGFILIAAALWPHDHTKRFLGLVLDQWAALLVITVMLAIAVAATRKVTAEDGRPEGLIRESKRINGMTAQGFWFSMALVVQLLFYFIWGKQYHIAAEAFWSGLFILMGSSCLAAAVSARAWTLLGWAIPFLGYGCCLSLVQGHGKVNGVLLGVMFIAVALSFSLIAVMQIRILERQHDAD